MRDDMPMLQQQIDCRCKEIVIFKYSKHAYVGNNAGDEKCFPALALSELYPPSGEVIDRDQKKQNEYIDWYKSHVKNTAGNQKVHPPQPMGQDEIKYSD